MLPDAPPLKPAVLARAARLRAAGASWAAVASELDLDPELIEEQTEAAGAAWRKALAAARRDVSAEAFDEALFALRRELRSPDDKARRESAEVILKFRMTELRHRPRLKPAKTAAAAAPVDPVKAQRRQEAEGLVNFLCEFSDEELARMANHMFPGHAGCAVAAPPTGPGTGWTDGVEGPTGGRDPVAAQQPSRSDGPLSEPPDEPGDDPGGQRVPRTPTPPTTPGGGGGGGAPRPDGPPPRVRCSTNLTGHPRGDASNPAGLAVSVPAVVANNRRKALPTGPGVATVPQKKPTRRKKGQEPTVGGILGVGLDGADGHRRITRTEEMVLVGGSQETHERMQETAIRFGEALEKRGKKLPEASVPEVIDLLREAIEKGR